MAKGKIIKVSGPLIIAQDIPQAKMSDVVAVGEKGIIGEIIELKGNTASIQVYEETGGLGPGDPVSTTDEPLSVELGPGLLGSFFDGIQRPLPDIQEKAGVFLTRGIKVPSLSREKKWKFKPIAEKGKKVVTGDILGEVPETRIAIHKVMVPPGIEGELINIKQGEFKIDETIATIKNGEIIHKVSMIQKWPVRKRRPLKEKLPPIKPLVTGQRIIDTLFPITMGGTACIPGPFGSGKTVIQHQLAKWSDADIIVFVGCGERGNEMTDVLLSFPKLKDPKTGYPLMERTVLIANTSNMPIAAREASVYTGAAIAEYFREMGYNVALMADSTSRWAEALREMSGRLEEMPGEEGYPAYLGTRVAEFYERAGRGICPGNDKREASLSIIGSVSPPGGDLSEPVVQNTLRIAKVFWGLDAALAYKRHYPAINWLMSYSLYTSTIKEYMEREVAEDFNLVREEAMKILQEESELEEIVRLVGMDALSPREQIVLQSAKLIREDFLYQSAYEVTDAFTSLKKQYRILKAIVNFHKLSIQALKEDVELKTILSIKSKEGLAKIKFLIEDKLDEIDKLEKEIQSEFLEHMEEKHGKGI